MALPLQPIATRFKIAFPAIAFFGGFLWDAITLGKSITSVDLFILLGYLVVAAILLIVMGRRNPAQNNPFQPSGAIKDLPGRGDQDFKQKIKAVLHWAQADGPAFALQFCFGSMFSALAIFYFLSSSYLPGFLLVIGLVLLLGLNEFLENHYHRFTLTWTLFGVCVILFLNFALPHLFRSLHPIWFFLSTALGVMLVYALKLLSPKAEGSLWPTYLMAVLLILLYTFNAIPPVPLVKKEMAICRGLEKKEYSYVAKIEKPKSFFFWRRSESRVRQLPGEKIFCFTSVFLPQGIACNLYHRWLYKDPKSGAWVEVSRIGFPIRGGRKEGFRGFTFKRNLAPGAWSVRVETETGRVLGTTHFRAETTSDSLLSYKLLELD